MKLGLERKTALVSAGVITLVIAAAAGAMAANFGILDSNNNPAGNLSPVSADISSSTSTTVGSTVPGSGQGGNVKTIYEDQVIRVPVGSAGTTGSSPGVSSPSNPVPDDGYEEGDDKHEDDKNKGSDSEDD